MMYPVSPGIYCFENLLDGKMYIGQSVNLNKRITRHECNLKKKSLLETSPKENPLLFNAVKKYGRENFCVKILAECSIDVLDHYEQKLIKDFGSHESVGGYNLSFGGPTSKGVKFSYKAKENMSKAHAGKTHSQEVYDKISKSNTGKKRSYSSSKYTGVHLVPRGSQKYWVVDVKRKGIRLFSGCFKDEICAAVFYDLEIIRLELHNSPLNFSDKERNVILSSDLWKNIKNFGKKKSDKSSSKFLGVLKYKNKYWKCQISNTYVGTYKSEIDAAQAYNDYVLENDLPYNLNNLQGA